MEAMKTSLKDALEATLPKRFECKLRYINTPPKLCDPLFSPPPGQGPERTHLASHFLAVSAPGIQNHGEGNLSFTLAHSDVMVLGIEVLVYTTKHLATIFVSKADSTGFMPQNPDAISVKPIVTTFLQWLTNQERQNKPGRKVVVSLFARAQSQYLFPGSAENERKHILDDRQLIRWWAKVLDSYLTHLCDVGDTKDKDPTVQGYLTVPGFELGELGQFYPMQRYPAVNGHKWIAGNPLRELAQAHGVSADVPPRCLLPRFPDDPKARFMQDLDDEVGLSEDTTTCSPTKRKSGMWSSIRDLDRFWETMEFRQECSSGRMVGFLWVVISPADSSTNGAAQGGSQESSQDLLESEPASQRDATPTPGHTTNSNPKKKRRPPTGPIVARKARLKGGSSSLSATSAGLNGMVIGAQGKEGLMLTKDGYDQAMQTLLHLDFANLDVAARSTSKWVSEVSNICGLASDFAVEVTGTVNPAGSASKAKVSGSGQVNDLGGMLMKKRKAADESVSEGSAVAEMRIKTPDVEVPVVHMLGAGTVRKKPKPPLS